MPALENGDTGAESRGFERSRQTRKTGADHADIDVEIKGQARAVSQRSATGTVDRACGSLAHGVSYEPSARLSPAS
jgi:hypothetical protein